MDYSTRAPALPSRLTARGLFFGLYVAALLSLFCSVGDLALGRAGLMPVQPVWLAIATLFPLAVLGVSRMRMLSGGQIRIDTLIRHHSPSGVPFLCVCLFAVLLGYLPGAFWAEAGKWIFLVPYGFLVFLFACVLTFVPGVEFRCRRLLQLPLLILVGSVLYELYAPGSFSTEANRAAGFAGNSNFSALATCMLCAAAMGYGRFGSLARDGALLIAAGLAVFATQSRSGVLEYLLLLLFFIGASATQQRLSPKNVLRILIGAAVAISVLAFSISWVMEQSAMFSQHATRLHKFMSESRVDDGSAGTRLSAAKESLRLIGESPLIGHGTGYSRRMETLPHNIYLQQWVNNGALGVVCYLAMLIGAFAIFLRDRFAPGMAFILVSTLGGFFSHNVLDQKTFLITLGILLTDSLISKKERDGLLITKAAAVINGR